MKKGLKIALIVVSTMLLIVGGTFGGTLWYSTRNMGYQIEDPIVTGYISEVTLLPPTYEGFILVDVPLEISNGGLYSVRDLVVIIDVFGQNFSSLSTLNGKLLGRGINPLGDIKHGTNWTGTLQLNMTTDIALLAVWNGDLRIEVDISVKVDFLVYEAPLSFNETHVEPWVAPF